MAKQFTYRMWLLETGIITRRTTSAEAALKWFQSQTKEPITFGGLLEILAHVETGRRITYWKSVEDVGKSDGGIKP